MHSRRIIRQRRQKLIRERWYVFAGFLVAGAVVCLAVKLLVWEPVDAYLIGAIAASTLWGLNSIVTSVDGLAARRVGVLGEEWTTYELRKMRRNGWRFVNHVMLEHVDIDHAVLGPAGFFAIDSKYRSEWLTAACYLDGFAADAQTQARKLQMRLQVETPVVQPVVVMWGPDIQETYDGAFEHHGVLFCPGYMLVEYLRALPASTGHEVIESSYSTLDRYVARRDIGEQRTFGEPLRSIGEHFNDLVLAGFAMGATLLLVFVPARIPPAGIWSVVAALLIAATSIVIRRRLRSSPRVQRTTTAAITTSVAIGALILGALVAEALS